MFLVNMTFTDINQITPELTEQHRQHLANEYRSQQMMFGGRKVPRTGGILISKHATEQALVDVLSKDPFVKSGAVSYTITEFEPVMASAEYEHLLG